MFPVMQQVIEAGPRTVPEGIRLLQHGLTDLRRRVRLAVCKQPLDALCAKLGRSPGALDDCFGYKKQPGSWLECQNRRFIGVAAEEAQRHAARLKRSCALRIVKY